MASDRELQERLSAALADRYRIEGEIGSGGMATVFLAEDLRHHRRVAIKVLHPGLVQTLGAERFLREIRTVASLTHPHILPLHDSGEAEGLLFYVMPYVKGESLRARLDKEGQLPVEDAIQIAREIADALAYAHGEGVVHRDVKPDNIMLEAGHAVLADFGVAHALAEAKEERLTKTGLSLGTPTYASPEQAAGGREPDGRSDQYALGCVLYEMLTGHPPFTGPEVESIVRQHLTVDPPPVTQVRTAVPTQVAGALTRAMAKSPADRYRTASEFGAALGQATMAAQGGPMPAPRRPPSTIRVGTLSLAAIAALALLVWAGIWFGRPVPVSEASRRVIVLPYDNQTGDPDLDPIGRMVAEEITEGLARTGEIQVVPSLMVLESLARIRGGGEGEGEEAAVRQLAQETKAGIAVTGAYYRRGDEMEVHSEVVDLATGEPLGAVETVRGSIADPTEAVAPVRDRVMGVLATRLRPGTAWEVPASVQPPTYEAFQDYARGNELWLQQQYLDAARWFTRAYEADTTFLRSLMIAAAAYGNGGDPVRFDSLLQVIEPRREKLAPYDRYRLDYGLAGARGDRAAQLRAARAATELVPSGTQRLALALSLVQNNRPREALESLEEVWEDFITVSRGWPPLWYTYADILHLLGDHGRELEVAREGKEMVADVLLGLGLEARALAALGRTEELDEVVNQVLAAPESPGENPGTVLEFVAEELRAHGHAVEAGQVIEEALSWLEVEPEEFRETPEARELRGRLLYLNRDWSEAGAVFEELSAEGPESSAILGPLGVSAARLGDSVGARNLSGRLAALKEPYRLGQNTLWRARIEAVLGNPKEAMTLLRRAFGEGISFGIWLHRDPALAELADYPTFQEFVRPRG
jgi:tRNA A-37 threonylcarbamoyl transferase component Bud32/TolB-like protein/tetratricopeptide (TPR) repeat protein